MSQKHDPEKEYELITKHIFFEDNSRLKRSQFFIGINLALFTMLAYFFKEYPNEKDSLFRLLMVLLPIVGVFISIFWAKMVGKVEGQLHLRVKRAVELEKMIGYNIYKAHKGVIWKWIREPSSWAIFIFLAFGFALIWFIIFSFVIKKIFYPTENWCYPILFSIILLIFYLIIDNFLTTISKKRRVI